LHHIAIFRVSPVRILVIILNHECCVKTTCQVVQMYLKILFQSDGFNHSSLHWKQSLSINKVISAIAIL